MSVFTPLSHEQMQQLLAPQQLALVRFAPASEGIENSNFFVTAVNEQGIQQELVLTLLEQLQMPATRWFQALLIHLAADGLPVPQPVGALQQFAGKPVVLAPCLPGQHPLHPTTTQAQALGRMLAQLHASDFCTPSPVANERIRLAELAQQLPRLPAVWQARAKQLLAAWQDTASPDNYHLIHGDLFRDNSLFVGDELSGLLDFYHASFELPVYDLAIALNDWALDEQARPQPQLAQALLDGYRERAPLPTPELLPLALAVAALRFWLSRLAASDKTASAGRGSKPPAEFAAKLALRWDELNPGECAG